MVCGDKPECHARADRDTGTWIGPAHDAEGVAADSIKTFDGAAVSIDHLRRCIRCDTGECGELARHDEYGVERRRCERCEAWIRLLIGPAVEALIGGVPARKVRVDPFRRMRIEMVDGCSQSFGADATPSR